MNTILEHFVAVAPYINELTNSDFAVSVCDLEKSLIYVPGKKLDHKIKSGSPHIKNSVTYQCIQEKKKQVKRVDKEVFGFPYIAIALPIFDDKGNILGSVCFTETVDKQDVLLSAADNLYTAMQEMTSAADIITEKTKSLGQVGKELHQVTVESIKKAEETDQILGFISTVSSQTNLLGLNAAIEAARLGKDGRGFGVVAEEIRKLAKTTDDYVKKVDSILKELKETTSHMDHKIEALLKISSQQGGAINSITEFTKEINKMAENLREQARLLSE